MPRIATCPSWHCYGRIPPGTPPAGAAIGNLWYHHVYMPAQNPGDPSGMSAYGRWMYGPWFWPPATPPLRPHRQPVLRPELQPGRSRPPGSTRPTRSASRSRSRHAEHLGRHGAVQRHARSSTAWPTRPSPWSRRPTACACSNAANDRFFNFQWYVADPTTGHRQLKWPSTPPSWLLPRLDPNIFPTPDTTVSPAGPDWVQIGTEGGFLPAPVVVDGQQVTTWITDPTRFDVGNVDQHSLLLAPAERADVIVDFSQFAGKTLILYNDAPAAFPARVPQLRLLHRRPGPEPQRRADHRARLRPQHPHHHAGQDRRHRPGACLQPGRAARLPSPTRRTAPACSSPASTRSSSGRPPTTRPTAPASPPAATATLPTARSRRATGSSVSTTTPTVRFQHAARADDHQDDHARPAQGHPRRDELDHLRRVRPHAGQPGRGGPAAHARAAERHPLPVRQPVDRAHRRHQPAEGQCDLRCDRPAGERRQVTPISDAADGTQIWRITHNGVDTHPIHFHLYDVQIVNRVTWDNIIIPTDANELGWKDTIRVSPLEDTIVALRPIIPQVPFEVPNAIRPLNPMMPLGSTSRCSTTSTRRATRPTRSSTSWSTSVGSTSTTATSSATKKWT